MFMRTWIGIATYNKLLLYDPPIILDIYTRTYTFIAIKFWNAPRFSPWGE